MEWVGVGGVRKTVFEMAAMPFHCNGYLSVVFSFTYSFVNVFQKLILKSSLYDPKPIL